MKTMTVKKQQEALEKINAKINEAIKLVKEAEAISEEAQVSFRWSGFDYGMGGTYYPARSIEKKKLEALLKLSAEERVLLGFPEDMEEYGSDGKWWGSNEGWVSSSGNC